MASHLVAILERCGVTQRTIAQELGVSPAAVSRWKTGARQMATAQQERLLAWAVRAEQEARERAAALDAVTPARSLLETNRHATRLTYDLQELWHDYHWETQPTAWKADLLAMLQWWGRYSQNLTLDHFDPTPQDLERLWADMKRLRRWITAWRRAGGAVTAAGRLPVHSDR
jgi:transcriptional regulator with XRE-family HTH domain